MTISSNAILNSLDSINKLLDKKSKKKGQRLLFLTGLISIADVLGLAVVVPVLMLAVDGNFLAKSRKLRAVFQFTGMPNEAWFIILLIIVVIFFFAVKNLLAILVQKKIQEYSIELVQEFTEKTFYHAVNQPFVQIVSRGTSELLQKVHFSSYHYASGIIGPFIALIGETTIILFVIIFVMWFNPMVFLLIACITGPAFYLINRTIKAKVFELGQRTKGYREETLESLNIGINGLADMKINHSSGYFIKDFLRKQRFLLESDFKSIQYQLVPSRANEFIVLIGVIMLVVYGYFFSENPAGLRLLGAVFVLSVFRLIPALNRLLVALMKIKQNQYTIEFLESYHTSEHQKIEKQLVLHKQIRLKNISFRHDGTSENLINGAELVINKGEIIGITGISGSGKSTLLKIISGLIQPREGEIVIDDTPLSSNNIKAWQNQLGFVHQSPFIFNKSLTENISFSKEADKEKLERVIKNAGIDEFIHQLPQRNDSVLGEQGIKISEGQKQRIAIARALYKNAKVLLFDEATSALDADSEKIIIESLKKLKEQSVTIIIIAHQNRILELCDSIYKLEKGSLMKI